MLTAFLKSPAEERCACQISKFADRIQVEEITKISESTRILRYFIISVIGHSPIPLQELHMLIPHPGVRNIIDTTYTFLNRDYKVNQASQLKLRVIDADKRLIVYDGIEPIKVFKEVTFSIEKVGDKYTLIKIYFNEPLRPGEHGAVRMEFGMNGLLCKRSKYEHEIFLRYFNVIEEEVISRYYRKELEVRCLPFYNIKKEIDREIISGGFDVVLQVPKEYEVTNTPVCLKPPNIISWNLDGDKDIERKTYIWRLRYFLEPSLRDCGMGKDIRIISFLKDNIAEKKEIFWRTLIWSGIVSAIVSLGIAILSKIILE